MHLTELEQSHAICIILGFQILTHRDIQSGKVLIIALIQEPLNLLLSSHSIVASIGKPGELLQRRVILIDPILNILAPVQNYPYILTLVLLAA